jgi:hypothetical protein
MFLLCCDAMFFLILFIFALALIGVFYPYNRCAAGWFMIFFCQLCVALGRRLICFFAVLCDACFVLIVMLVLSAKHPPYTSALLHVHLNLYAIAVLLLLLLCSGVRCSRP